MSGGVASRLRGRFCGDRWHWLVGGQRLQLTAVHHVVHGTLHLQQHTLFLSLRDSTKANS